MAEFLIELGREQDLCREELSQVLIRMGYPRPQFWDQFAILNSDNLPDPDSFCSLLGGTIRCLQLLGEWNDQSLLDIESGTWFIPQGPWAISALSPGLGQHREQLRQLIRQLIAQRDDAHGREERTPPGEDSLVPARVFSSRLHEKRSELCLVRGPSNEILIGITTWVYSPEEYGERDVSKPHRPRRRGLLPPKLARQMINLAGGTEGKCLLDPFCGSGVVLLEGLSLGMSVGGSDNRSEAIQQTRENIEWYNKHYQIDTEDRILFLQNVDVRQLSLKTKPLSWDCVVGEGDLGPPIKGALSRKFVAGLLKGLEDLYVRAFAEIRIVLKPGGKVCLATPFWQPNEGDPMFLNLARRLLLMGYHPVIQSNRLEPILYRRKDQRVGRAIYLLQSPS